MITATEARANLPALIDKILQSDEPTVIASEKGNAVLLSENYWNGVKETLYLLSAPGMRDAVREGLEANPSDLSETLSW